MDKMKISLNIERELYSEYKKAMIDLRTTPTADLTRYISSVVENTENSLTAKGSKDGVLNPQI